MTQLIDYTKMRANKKQRLVKCPECGKIGKLHKYTDGSAGISHKGIIELGFFNVKEHCYFKTWES